MKRGLLLLLVLALVVVPVSADMLWEPYENNYYRNHSGDLQYMDRRYAVPEGSTANVYTQPNARLLQTLDPGTVLYVGPYGTISGETWAAAYVIGDHKTQGWVRLDRLQLQYDHKAFCEEFQSEIKNETLNLKVADLKGQIPSWTYPGSWNQQSAFTFSGEDDSYNDGNLTCSMIYTDPAGGRWGYVPYHMQWEGWIYLDDLYTMEPPVFPQVAENTVTQRGTEKAGVPTILPAIGGVAALVLVTGGVILVLKRRQKNQ